MARSLRICFLGESFVNGTGDPECLGWTGRICQAAIDQGHDITHYNLGIRRETSRELLARAPQEIPLRLPPDCHGRVIYSFGTNDTTWENGKTRIALDESVNNLTQLLTWTTPQYPVLVISPCPIDDSEQNARTQDLVSAMAEVAQIRNVAFLDVFTPLLTSSVWLPEAKQNDGAHPLAQGYAELAAIISHWPAWQQWFTE